MKIESRVGSVGLRRGQGSPEENLLSNQDFSQLLCHEIVAAFSQMAASVEKDLVVRIAPQKFDRIQKRRILMSSGKLAEFVVDRVVGNLDLFGILPVRTGWNRDRSDNKLLHIGLNGHVVQALKFPSNFEPVSVE